MAWEGAICHLHKFLILSNFHKAFFVVPQGRRAFLCHHRAAGLFCAATRQQDFSVVPQSSRGFLCCHGVARFLFFIALPPGSRLS